jgi:hypothetical protein
MPTNNDNRWTSWDDDFDRPNSRDPHEQPILLNMELLFEHMHLLGSTGSGKTSSQSGHA